MSVNKGKKTMKGFNQLSAEVSSFADLVDDTGSIVTPVTPRYNKNNAQDAVNSAPEHMPSISVPLAHSDQQKTLPEKEIFKTYGQWVKDNSFVFDQVISKVKTELIDPSISDEVNAQRYAKFLLCYHSEVNNINNAWYRETEVSRLRAEHILDQLVYQAKTNLYLSEAESLNNVLQLICEKHELYISEQDERIKNLSTLLEEKENIINNQTSELEKLNNLHKKASQANQSTMNDVYKNKKRPQSNESKTYTTTEKVAGGIVIGALAYGAYVLVTKS